MSDENICPRCGGVLRVDWTISFIQLAPREMRFEPKELAEGARLCPGHPSPTGSAERDTRYAAQASTLYSDLVAMIVEGAKAVEAGDDVRAERIAQDARQYLARQLFDIVEGDAQ